jgi:hypothetical protein
MVLTIVSAHNKSAAAGRSDGSFNGVAVVLLFGRVLLRRIGWGGKSWNRYQSRAQQRR